MKYVRTEDAIYVFNDYADYMQYANIKDTFIKETNSIEELCDEFVIDNPNADTKKTIFNRSNF